MVYWNRGLKVGSKYFLILCLCWWFAALSLQVLANTPDMNAVGKRVDRNVEEDIDVESVKRIYMVVWRGLTDAERGFMYAMMNQPYPVEFIIRNAGKNKQTLRQIRADVLRQKPDLVYSFGTTVTSTLAGTESDAQVGINIAQIPLIFNIVADPAGAGIVSQYEQPSRNVTGTSHLVPMATQVAAMQEMEGVESIGVIYNPKEKNSTLQVKALKVASEQAGLTLVTYPLPDAVDHLSDEYFSEFVNLLSDRSVDIAYLPSDSFLISHAKSLVKRVHDAGVPVFSATEGPIRKAGAYMGIVSRYYNVGQFAAYKAEQVLFKGKKVSEVPVETLKRFSFIVNMDAAKHLDLYPPITIMQTAEVVQSQ